MSIGIEGGRGQQDVVGPGCSWQNLSPKKSRNFRISIKGGGSFSNYWAWVIPKEPNAWGKGKGGEVDQNDSHRQQILGKNQYRQHNGWKSVPASIAGCHLQAGHCDILRTKPKGGVHGNQQLRGCGRWQPRQNVASVARKLSCMAMCLKVASVPWTIDDLATATWLTCQKLKYKIRETDRDVLMKQWLKK